MMTTLPWWWTIPGTWRVTLKLIKSMTRVGLMRRNQSQRNSDSHLYQFREVDKLAETTHLSTLMIFTRPLQMPQELMYQRWCTLTHPWKRRSLLSRIRNSRRKPNKICHQETHSKVDINHNQLKGQSSKQPLKSSFKTPSLLQSFRACK